MGRLSAGHEHATARLALAETAARQRHLTRGQKLTEAARVHRAAVRLATTTRGRPVGAGTAEIPAHALLPEASEAAGCTPDPGRERMPLDPVTTGVTGWYRYDRGS